MVGGLSPYNRDILDTDDSDASVADQIRSHHSVLRVNENDSSSESTFRLGAVHTISSTLWARLQNQLQYSGLPKEVTQPLRLPV